MPLAITQLQQLDQWLAGKIAQARQHDARRLGVWLRNRPMVLLGFWRAFRSDELCRLTIEDITLAPSAGMSLYLRRSKGDRQAERRLYKVPALRQCCPVEACQDWLDFLNQPSGALFRAIIVIKRNQKLGLPTNWQALDDDITRRLGTRSIVDVLVDAERWLGLHREFGPLSGYEGRVEGRRAAADGTKWNLYEQNLLSEYHIRYGGYGGIGYYHARLVHGDTQAQSYPVFGLAYLLGIKLMPRIRNLKDLNFYWPDRRYGASLVARASLPPTCGMSSKKW